VEPEFQKTSQPFDKGGSILLEKCPLNPVKVAEEIDAEQV
jgi:hypothetical protein